MGYASIEGEDSHRQNKKFKQRIKYRLDQGYSYDEALALASTKLRLVPDRQSSDNPDEKNPRIPDYKLSDFRPSESRKAEDEKSSDGQNALPASFSYIPSDEEVRREVERLKSEGVMTEIPSLPKIVSEAGAVAGNSVGHSAQVKPSFIESEKLYWIVAGMASVWLTIAMVGSLSGHPALNLLVALSFSFGPMLILAPKLSAKDQKIAKWGAGIVFTLDAMLYLLPSAQVLWNESRAYYLVDSAYTAASQNFDAQRINSSAIVEDSKKLSDEAKRAYDTALESFGTSSWRTAAAKKEYEKKFGDWKTESEKAFELLKAPEIPKLNQAITESAQALAIRVGLFLVVYFLMFVRRQRI